MALVLLVGWALLSSVGPFDTGDSTPGAAVPLSSLEKQAERVEKQLEKSPEDSKLLLAATKAWIQAGNGRLGELETRTQSNLIPVAADFEAGMQVWNRYLQQTDGEAGANIAQLAGDASFKLVEIGSTDPGEAAENAGEAVRAQQIAVKSHPIFFTISHLACFEYFTGEFAAGERAAKLAVAMTGGKTAAKGVRQQLDEYRERGEKFVARVKRGAKELEESGEEELEAPIKGYGSPAGVNGYEPGTGPT